jgi:hypothetical protein
MPLEKAKKEVIDQKFKGVQIKMDSEFGIINMSLEKILEQTTRHNNRMTKAEDRLKDLEEKELTHVITCPMIPKVRTLEDNALSSKSIKGWMYKSAGIAAIIISAVWILFQLLTQNKI